MEKLIVVSMTLLMMILASETISVLSLDTQKNIETILNK